MDQVMHFFQAAMKVFHIGLQTPEGEFRAFHGN
jgi:hypothetical protein